MNKLFASLALAGLTTVICTNVLAETPPRAPVNLIPTAAPAATTAPAAQQEQRSPETEELRDGTKIEISDDDTVTIINTDGTRSTAPDGILTLKDQTTFDVRDGKRVDY